MNNYPADRDIVEKIIARQMDAIDTFHLLSIHELKKFVNKLRGPNGSKLQEQYGILSTGYSNVEEHRKVSQKLAEFIKASIK